LVLHAFSMAEMEYTKNKPDVENTEEITLVCLDK
jgi:hypothetical protein